MITQEVGDAVGNDCFSLFQGCSIAVELLCRQVLVVCPVGQQAFVVQTVNLLVGRHIDGVVVSIEQCHVVLAHAGVAAGGSCHDLIGCATVADQIEELRVFGMCAQNLVERVAAAHRHLVVHDVRLTVTRCCLVVDGLHGHVRETFLHLQATIDLHHALATGILHLHDAATLCLIIGVSVFDVANDNQVVEHVGQTVGNLVVGSICQRTCTFLLAVVDHVVVVAVSLHCLMVIVVVELIEDGIR